MPERDEKEDASSTFKALPVFRTLRTNLALFSSIARRSGIEPTNYSGEDLGFVGVESGENQLKVHNGAITSILIALVTQALSNYVELKSIKPRLEDPDLEEFPDRFEDRERFFRGMKKARNAVFHVRSRRAWRDRDVAFLGEVLQQRVEAGDSDVVGSLSALLYDFTGKCFTGDLKIWPLRYYEALEAPDPDLRGEDRRGRGFVRRGLRGVGRELETGVSMVGFVQAKRYRTHRVRYLHLTARKSIRSVGVDREPKPS